MSDAYVYDAIRTPRGKGRPDGGLHEVTAVRLSADILNALQARTGGACADVEDVIWGNVTQIGEQGGCLARSAVLLSDLPEKVPGLSVNRFCASGLEAVNLAANQKVAASSLFNVSDLDFGAGDKILKYEFFDDTQGGGSFNFKNVVQAADKTIAVNAADLGKLAFDAAASSASDLIWARASDGDSWSDWHSIYAHTL